MHKPPEMFEDTILLKIKREFTESEAISQLLKMVSEKEIEIGYLKSELEEARYKSVQKTGTKKEWIKDDLIAYLDDRNKKSEKLYKDALSSLSEWRNKYFSLIAKNKTI